MKKIKVGFGTDKDPDYILIPTPPRNANCFKLTVQGENKTGHACVAIKDIDTLLGVSGELRFVEKKGVKKVREHQPSYTWTGCDILELKEHHEGQKGKK